VGAAQSWSSLANLEEAGRRRFMLRFKPTFTLRRLGTLSLLAALSLMVLLRDGISMQQTDYFLAVLVFRKTPTRAHSICCLPSVPSQASRHTKKRNTSSPATNRHGQISTLCTGEPPLTALADHMPMRAPYQDRYAGTGICVLLNITRTRHGHTHRASSCYTDLLIYRRACNVRQW
jgi:hypothetical protein